MTKTPRPPDNDIFQAATAGACDWLRLSLKRAPSPLPLDKQGLTVLHVACLYGRLNCMKLLLESQVVGVNTSCPQGRRPIHMVLTSQSRPLSHTCLSLLLEHEAQPNTTTNTGLTPLHLAATEGLWECTHILVQAGADIGAQDNRGHTPLDLARIWCHRGVARYLKNSMWLKDKRRDLGRRKALQRLHKNLVDVHQKAMGREKLARQNLTEKKVTEWADRKGLPLLWTPPRPMWIQAHGRGLSSSQRVPSKGKVNVHKASPEGLPPREAWNISPNPSKPPTASLSRPQGVRLSSQPQRPPPEPDLRRSVTLGRTRDGQPQYIAKWDGSPQLAPSLPMDVLRRGLFPNAYPPRIASACHFSSQHVLDLPRLGCSPAHSTSPWTEVAMHLVEELESGHY